MDDPIFDPWSQGEDETPTPTPQRPSRWRSARHDARGVPASRPLPGPLGPPVSDSEEANRSDGADTGATKPSVEPSTPEEPTPASDPHRLAWPDLEGRAQPDALDDLLATAPGGSRKRAPAAEERDAEPDAVEAPPGTAGFLRALVMPRIEALSHRLVVAHHGTALDDRLDESEPVLRFRIEPWSGPFDEAEERHGAVLEIVTDGPRARWITGRLWLDPTSHAPSELVEVAVAALTEEWIERLLLDFVEKALSQA